MTDLASVLRALDSSPRLTHWHKPPRDYGPDNPEDSDYNRNGLKDVGDLSKLIISPGCSFIDPPDEEEQEQQQEEEEQLHTLQYSREEEEEVQQPQSLDIQEKRYNELPESLIIARTALEQNQLRWMLEDMKLEEQLSRETQQRVRAKQKAIMDQVYCIRLHHAQRLQQWQQQWQQKLAEEEEALRQQEEEAAQAVATFRKECEKKAEEQYSKWMAVVKAAQEREAERASEWQELLNCVVSTHHTFTEKLALVENLLGEFEGSLGFDGEIESVLNQKLTSTQEVLTKAQHNTATHSQLQDQLDSLQEGCTFLLNVIESLKEKKAAKKKAEEQEQKAAEEAQQKEAAAAAAAATAAAAAVAAAAAAAEVKQEQEQQVPQQQQTISHLDHWHRRIVGWEKEAEKYLTARDRIHKSKLLEVRRKLSIVNQFNVASHSINREKLQKLLGMLKGQGLEEWGAMPDVVDYLKNEVVLSIVKQGTMVRNETGIALYSWVMVSVLAFFPELWGVFIYHLNSRCLCLFNPVPKYGQSIEAYLDAVGYNSVGAGKFSAHVDGCATMFSLVLAMLSDKKESPLLAPAVAWEYLATMLALPPVSGVMSEILFNVLRCCGNHLLRLYGKQFHKLLDFVVKTYMPRLQEVVDMGGQQSFIMLCKLMAEFSTRRTLPLNENLTKYR